MPIGNPIYDRAGQAKLWLGPDGALKDGSGTVRGKYEESTGKVLVRGKHVAWISEDALLDLQGRLLGRFSTRLAVQTPRQFEGPGVSVSPPGPRTIPDESLCTPGGPPPSAVRFISPRPRARKLPVTPSDVWSNLSVEEVFGLTS